MGGEPYWYVVPYQEDLQGALDALREREFAAGRYSPVIWPFRFGEPGFFEQKPGPQHESIGAALDASEPSGTASILDIDRISEEPDFCAAAPFSGEELIGFCGSERPTRAAVEASRELLGSIDRGQARYVILYEGGRPTEIYFGGYSFD